MNSATPILILAAALACPACATRLPDAPPPLVDMQEPLELFAEPDDEARRIELPLGGFTGAYVGDARQTLEAMLGDAQGVEVVRIVENSPADAGGLLVGDVLLEARVGDGAPRALQYPSDWRAIELAAGDGSTVAVVLDRANRRTSTTLRTVARLRPVDRQEPMRLREEDRVGLAVRTATEVEARAAGLAPGAGAVIVGLSKHSPWRAAGLRFGDVVVAADGREIAHPEVVIEAIRGAGETMTIGYFRDGERHEVETALSRRVRDMREFYVPLLVDFEADRGSSDTSLLLGMFRYEQTKAAWRLRLFWLIRLGGGDEDELLEVDG